MVQTNTVVLSLVNIIHVIRRFVPNEWGGIEAYVLAVSQALTQQGINTRVFSTSALSDIGTFEYSGISGYRFSYLYPCFPLSPELHETMDRKGGNPVSLSLFFQILRLPRNSVVHLHTMGRLAALVRLACRLRKLPYVVSLHAGHFCVPPIEKLYFKRLSTACLDWGKLFHSILGVKKILMDADAVICFGSDEYRAAQKELMRPVIKYLPHGLALSSRKEGDGKKFREKYCLENSLIILCVGRIDSQKNQLALVEALPDLRRTCPEVNLVLIGPITVQAYFEEILEKVQALEIKEAVEIIPGLPPDSQDLANAYSACDIFVLPSVHEPFGIVILEAWSHGKPVVISPLASLQGVVEDGINGIWAKGTDSSSLGDVIGTLLKKPKLREKVGKSGLETLKERFTQDRHMSELRKLYCDLASQRI